MIEDMDGRLIAAAPALLAALKALEWQDQEDGGNVYLARCASCAGCKFGDGHEPDCQLDAAIRLAEPVDPAAPVYNVRGPESRK